METGKTVLVVGASSGIGEAIAEAVSENPVRLILFARRLERLETLVERLQERAEYKAVEAAGNGFGAFFYEDSHFAGARLSSC